MVGLMGGGREACCALRIRRRRKEVRHAQDRRGARGAGPGSDHMYLTSKELTKQPWSSRAPEIAHC